MTGQDPGGEKHVKRGTTVWGPAKSLNYALLLQRKNMIGLCWSADNQMSSRRQHSTYMVSIIMFDVLQNCLSRFPKLDSLKPEQIKELIGIASRRLQ